MSQVGQVVGIVRKLTDEYQTSTPKKLKLIDDLDETISHFLSPLNEKREELQNAISASATVHFINNFYLFQGQVIYLKIVFYNTSFDLNSCRLQKRYHFL